MAQAGTGRFEDLPFFVSEAMDAVSRNLFEDGIHLTADEFFLRQFSRRLAQLGRPLESTRHFGYG